MNHVIYDKERHKAVVWCEGAVLDTGSEATKSELSFVVTCEVTYTKTQLLGVNDLLIYNFMPNFLESSQGEKHFEYRNGKMLGKNRRVALLLW